LICNGEIFNHKVLIDKYGFKQNSSSDCEVILHMYHKFLYEDVTKDTSNTLTHPITKLCNELDGEFAFILYDTFSQNVILSRDNFGVRPLFIGYNCQNNICSFGSQLKALYKICDKIKQFEPGTFAILNIDIFNKQSDMFKPLSFDCFLQLNYHSIYKLKSKDDFSYDETYILGKINKLLRNAVNKRLMSERPVCCLLSGGLDSSLIASLVASHYEPYQLKTFSIGLKDSPDLYYAKKVADFIKSNHTSIELTESDFLNNIENTIDIIESYDTTSVRASVGNYLVAKYINENTDCKVVFNGDYSDEVCGGYKYLWNAPTPNAFDDECKHLIKDICYYDSLRSDRTISSQGLEARVPFADKEFVEFYLSIPSNQRMPSKANKRPEKYLLRKAFENDGLLPQDVLWRPKEAFSDGVSKQDNSWHMIIQNYINDIITDDEFHNNITEISINKPTLKETYFYRKVFEKKYSKFVDVIPYYWMPKWSGDVDDPSARTINIC
jgi:asparagine synthase (glutamine-hydrolysing)